MGFSTSTWRPRARRASPTAAWAEVGTATTAAWAAAARASRLAKTGVPGACSRTTASAAAFSVS